MPTSHIRRIVATRAAVRPHSPRSPAPCAPRPAPCALGRAVQGSRVGASSVIRCKHRKKQEVSATAAAVLALSPHHKSYGESGKEQEPQPRQRQREKWGGGGGGGGEERGRTSNESAQGGGVGGEDTQAPDDCPSRGRRRRVGGMGCRGTGLVRQRTATPGTATQRNYRGRRRGRRGRCPAAEPPHAHPSWWPLSRNATATGSAECSKQRGEA